MSGTETRGATSSELSCLFYSGIRYALFDYQGTFWSGGDIKLLRPSIRAGAGKQSLSGESRGIVLSVSLLEDVFYSPHGFEQLEELLGAYSHLNLFFPSSSSFSAIFDTQSFIFTSLSHGFPVTPFQAVSQPSSTLPGTFFPTTHPSQFTGGGGGGGYPIVPKTTGGGTGGT